MAFELRELQGNIFNNKHKETDRQPDMKGDLLLNGVPHEIALWHKNGAKGPFIGFKISEKREKQQPAEQPISQRAMPKRPDPISSGRSLKADMDDDIPFSAEFR
jgi:hypothetical protein